MCDCGVVVLACRARHHLHIVFATSPVGVAFRTRCRQFPSLVNCMTIDWFSPWAPEALLGVGVRILEGLSLVGGAQTSTASATVPAAGAKVASTCGSVTSSSGASAAPAALQAGVGAAAAGSPDCIVLRVAKMCVEMHKGVEAASEQLFQEQQRR